MSMKLLLLVGAPGVLLALPLTVAHFWGLLTPALVLTFVACFSLFIYWRSLAPTHDRLERDLSRLATIVPLAEFEASRYETEHVCHYYASTTFRDYKLLELATSCNAMHTELVPASGLPFKTGHLQQLLYVISHLGEQPKNGSILEVGFGKGSNSVFLASLFKRLQFVGLDVVDEHVEYAQAYAQTCCKLPNVQFVKGDACLPPETIREMRYSIIFGIESFCHIDSDAKLGSFLQFAAKSLLPRGKIIIVDGFRSRKFHDLSTEVQQAMNLAESGFRIRRMASKVTWKSTAAAAGFEVLEDLDLTDQAVRFWTKGWKVAELSLLLPSLLRLYFSSSPRRAETGANFVAVLMTAYAMSLGSAEYGVLVLQKKT